MTDRVFRKKLFVFQMTFFVLSYVLIALGVTLYFSYINIKHDYIMVDATVIDIVESNSEENTKNEKNRIIIQYIVDATIYETDYPFFDESLDISEHINVYVRL